MASPKLGNRRRGYLQRYRRDIGKSQRARPQPWFFTVRLLPHPSGLGIEEACFIRQCLSVEDLIMLSWEQQLLTVEPYVSIKIRAVLLIGMIGGWFNFGHSV